MQRRRFGPTNYLLSVIGPGSCRRKEFVLTPVKVRGWNLN
jgi:hypothetical protein